MKLKSHGTSHLATQTFGSDYMDLTHSFTIYTFPSHILHAPYSAPLGFPRNVTQVISYNSLNLFKACSQNWAREPTPLELA